MKDEHKGLTTCPFCGMIIGNMGEEYSSIIGKTFRYAKCGECEIMFVDLNENRSLFNFNEALKNRE